MSHVRIQRIQHPPPPVGEEGQHVTGTREREFQLMMTPRGSQLVPHATTAALTNTTVHSCCPCRRRLRGDIFRRTEQQCSRQELRLTKTASLCALPSSLASTHTLTPLLECMHMITGRPAHTWAGIAFHQLASPILLRGRISSLFLILCLSFSSQILDFGKGRKGGKMFKTICWFITKTVNNVGDSVVPPPTYLPRDT